MGAATALFAFAYFLFALAPVMGIFNVNFFTCSQVSDHLQYLAVPGMIAFLAAGLARVLQSFNPAVFRSLAAVLALVLCVLTWQHQKPFANSESLWQHNLAGNPNSWKMHNGLGTALAVNGKVEAAVDEFKAALRTAPDHGDLHFNLAHALRLTGRLNEAIEQYRIALQGGPHLANAHNDLGNLLLQRGRGPEAIAQYQAAIDLHPANPLFLNNLAWLMATCPQASVRNGARAVELAQQAERLSGGKNSAMLGTLAAAYAEAGRFPEAVSTAQLALDLATSQTNTAQADILRANIGLYQAHLPLRDTGQTNAIPNRTAR